MTSKDKFDHQAAHRTFSTACFNRAWELIEKPQRSPEEDEEMIRLSMASHWHWTQRPDYGAQEESIATWQLARIYTIIGRFAQARHYAALSLDASQDASVAAVFRGYAYEALARVAAASGETEKASQYAAQVREIAQDLTDEGDRKALLNDLESIPLD